MLAVLQKHPSGPALQRLGAKRLTALLQQQRVHHPERLAEHLVRAAQAQTVQVPGANMAARRVAELAGQLAQALNRREALGREYDHKRAEGKRHNINIGTPPDRGPCSTVGRSLTLPAHPSVCRAPSPSGIVAGLCLDN